MTAIPTLTSVSTMPSARRRGLALPLILYIIWTLATWLLEGRIETLLRPDAILARLSYALIANLLVGLLGTAWLLRRVVAAGIVSPEQLGFQWGRRALASVVCGLLLGFGFYLSQCAPTLDPIVIINAFAQVLVVSAAEVLVCWVVIGATYQALLRPVGRAVAVGAAVLLSSMLVWRVPRGA